MTDQTTNDALDQANAQMQGIREMVAALECDYGRLEELREQYADAPDDYSVSKAAALHFWEITGPSENHQRRSWGDYPTKLEAIVAAWCVAEPEYDHTSDADELTELEAIAGENESRDDAETAIQQDALSVEVRSDWRTVGSEAEDSDFRIVLCTGGPHVQIMGELNNGEPTRAWLEYADWFTGMTERVNDEGDQDALLSYASRFFCGE